MSELTAHACRRPAVATMDHLRGFEPDCTPMVSRWCATCGTHWYGEAGVAVFEIPRREWDAWIGAQS